MFHVIHCSFHDPNLRAGHGENLTPPGAAGLAGHDGGADGGGPLQPPHHLAGRPGHVTVVVQAQYNVYYGYTAQELQEFIADTVLSSVILPL